MAFVRRAEFDESVRAIVRDERVLAYGDGADPSLDRPAYVRAASGMAMVNGRIVICQDDADFLAVLDPATNHISAVPLPLSPAGVRLFDTGRGNKPEKADLESCLYVPDRDLLLAFGSGSTDRRFRVAAAQGWSAAAPRVWWIEAATLYRRLGSLHEFAGSELNIEGVTNIGGVVRFFQRGNGAPRDGLRPVNATADVPLAALLAYLESPGRPPPAPGNVVQYDLGAFDGVPFTFTDACSAADGSIHFLAAAEDSPDTYRDGPLVAMALGRIAPDGATQMTLLRGEDGGLFLEKGEGLLLDPGGPRGGDLVVDHDDFRTPATIWRLEIEGRWRS